MMEMIDILVRYPEIQTEGDHHHDYRRMMNRTSTLPRLIQKTRDSRSIEWEEANAAQVRAHGGMMRSTSQYADYVPPPLGLTDEMKEARMPPRGGKGTGFLSCKPILQKSPGMASQKAKVARRASLHKSKQEPDLVQLDVDPTPQPRRCPPWGHQ